MAVGFFFAEVEFFFHEKRQRIVWCFWVFQFCCFVVDELEIEFLEWWRMYFGNVVVAVMR